MNNSSDNNNVKEISTFECICDNTKKYSLRFDGGSIGVYIIEYCQECFDNDDKEFLISMEVLDEHQ